MNLLIIFSILIFCTSLVLVSWAVKRLKVCIPNSFAVSGSNLKPKQKQAYNNVALPFIQFYYLVILGAILFNAANYYMISHFTILFK